ncbi:MAG: hypothetical protein K2N94_13215 [Lachnospiraceae bacterium]|nr:hypothetical protein [Lachnospiraceae bacterium]
MNLTALKEKREIMQFAELTFCIDCIIIHNTINTMNEAGKAVRAGQSAVESGQYQSDEGVLEILYKGGVVW